VIKRGRERNDDDVLGLALGDSSGVVAFVVVMC